MRRLVIISVVLFVLGCNPNSREPAVVDLVESPTFNSDSAFGFIEQQLAFGPRVPTTAGHQLCGDFISSKLTDYGLQVTEQKDTVIGFDQSLFPLRNIIGSINPENPKRILLCAHWDSRPYTDQAKENRADSLVGANDNASGVSILLEIARNLGEAKPDVGVDLVFFDMEDQGRPVYGEASDPEDHGYCLGSIYWAENLNGYNAEYGILLDMVGAKDAVFALESISMANAKQTLYKVWDMGHQLGFGDYFQYNRVQPVYDDHKYINEGSDIPCIDIIDHDATTPSEFGKYWHTHADNIELIDKKTLQAVGQTVLQSVYNQTQ